MCVAASAVAEQAAKNVRKNAKQKNKAFAKQGTDSIITAHFERRMGRYPSGQRGQTVNLLAYAYAGSNPALPTTFILSELKTKAPPQRRGFFFECAQNVLTFSARAQPTSNHLTALLLRDVTRGGFGLCNSPSFRVIKI